MDKDIPYTVLKLIAQRIKNGDTLDSLDLEIYRKYKQFIHLIIETDENNR